ncbi:MAG: hypothetical protein ACE5FZ_08220 [Nitrospiria bacterium]
MKQEKSWIRRRTAHLFVGVIFTMVLSGCGEDNGTGQISITATANDPSVVAQSSPSLFGSMWAFVFGREALADVLTCGGSGEKAISTDENPGTTEICLTNVIAILRKVTLNPFDGNQDHRLTSGPKALDLLGVDPILSVDIVDNPTLPAGVPQKEIRFRIDASQGGSAVTILTGNESILIEGSVLTSSTSSPANTKVDFRIFLVINERMDLLLGGDGLTLPDGGILDLRLFFDLEQVFKSGTIAVDLEKVAAMAATATPSGSTPQFDLKESDSGDKKILLDMIKNALDDMIDLRTDSGTTLGTFTPCDLSISSCS